MGSNPKRSEPVSSNTIEPEQKSVENLDYSNQLFDGFGHIFYTTMHSEHPSYLDTILNGIEFKSENLDHALNNLIKTNFYEKLSWIIDTFCNFARKYDVRIFIYSSSSSRYLL